MAGVVQEKSRGLKFAEQQLLRHGWEHGKGLGKTENGISEAIKVKVKCDKGGVGHKEGEQFTFHWWDHVFNKASSSLQVESDQTGIKLKKTAEEDKDNSLISNKKPRKATLAKAKLYGCFVKSATLLSGQEQPVPNPTQLDNSSSSDEEDEKLDLSSTTKLSDADLMKACGGRTAHKGARHGLTMNAKLARLEQQEAEFMAKYGKKNQPTSTSTVCVASATTPPTSQSTEQRSDRQEEMPDNLQRKKKKKTSGWSINEINGDDLSENPDTGVELKSKKKKVSKKAEETSGAVFTEEVAVHSHKTKRNHKKKTKVEQKGEERETPEEMTELHADAKKKKLSKHRGKEEESNYTESSQSEVVQAFVTKNKAGVLLEEADGAEKDSPVKQKKKKCKKEKLSVNDSLDTEEHPSKKKKKKLKE